MKRVGLIFFFFVIFLECRAQDSLRKIRFSIATGPVRPNIGEPKRGEILGRKFINASVSYNVNSNLGIISSYDRYFGSGEWPSENRSTFSLGVGYLKPYHRFYLLPSIHVGISLYGGVGVMGMLKSELGIKHGGLKIFLLPFGSSAIDFGSGLDGDYGLGLGVGYSIKTVRPKIDVKDTIPRKQNRKFSIAYGMSYIPLESDPRSSNSGDKLISLNKNNWGSCFTISFARKILPKTWISFYRTTLEGMSNITTEHRHLYVSHYSNHADVSYYSITRETYDYYYGLVRYGIKGEQIFLDDLFFLSALLEGGITSKKWEGELGFHAKNDLESDHFIIGVESNIGIQYKREKLFLTPSINLPINRKNYYERIKYDYVFMISLGYSHALYKRKKPNCCMTLFN